ncbi:hypothetical protein SUGI_0986690 [Cryptomeria japonica]|nr:hypothetical protein SUGI_0986690 [Cryptomeria japonica]
MSCGGRQGLFSLWKYFDCVSRQKGTGGTVTIKYKLCPMAWQGIYTRVKAHFLQIPRKGVDPCTNDGERYDVVKAQEKDDEKFVNPSSHASTRTTIAAQSQNRESKVGVSSRDVATEIDCKRSHIGCSKTIGILFDKKDREAIDASIA